MFRLLTRVLAHLFFSNILDKVKDADEQVAEEKVKHQAKTIEKQAALDTANQYIDTFDLPNDLSKQLRKAADTGELKTDWAASDVSEQELQEAGVSLSQVSETELDRKIENLASGFTIEDEEFEKMLTACIPLKDKDNEQALSMKAESLAMMGLTALSTQNYDQAKKAFDSFLSYYRDDEISQVVYLEYSRMLFEQGDKTGALSVLDQAFSQFGKDLEFREVANSLKETIESDE